MWTLSTVCRELTSFCDVCANNSEEGIGFLNKQNKQNDHPERRVEREKSKMVLKHLGISLT